MMEKIVFRIEQQRNLGQDVGQSFSAVLRVARYLVQLCEKGRIEMHAIDKDAGTTIADVRGSGSGAFKIGMAAREVPAAAR